MFSAGTTSLDPESYGVPDRVSFDFEPLVRTLFPWILANETPFCINVYPATMPLLSSAINVDCHLQFSVFTRALELCRRHNRHAIIIGQPLLVGEYLTAHVLEWNSFPERMVIATGGAYCPASLERAITLWTAARHSRVDFVSFYGLSEVDSGCLFSTRRDQTGAPLYQARSDIEVSIGPDSILGMRRKQNHGSKRVVKTEERAVQVADNTYVLNFEARMSQAIQQAIEAWGPDEWERRTGHMHRIDANTVLWQLRNRSELVPSALELPFHTYASLFGSTQALKPRWV